jgi:hypothetical protein
MATFQMVNYFRYSGYIFTYLLWFCLVQCQTASCKCKFYNKRISTDPILVTWQSTVYDPPEDGFKKRLKHVGASVKCF